ncbi:MAG: FG-GAP repeat domain-containing protein, partial [bacterium]
MRNAKTTLLLICLCFSSALQAGVHQAAEKNQKPQTAPARVAVETLMNLEHNTGNLRVAIFNDGSIGADNVTFAGPGISWKGQNGAFTGGPVFGSTQRGSVNGLMGFSSNASVFDVQNVASDFAAGFQATAGFNQTTNATLNDNAAPLPYGVEILQRSYSNAGEDFVMIRYGFVNKSGERLTDFFAGIHVDWDVGSATTNSGGYALEENLVYNFDLGPGPYYFGIAALNGLSGMITTSFGSAVTTLRSDAFAYLATFDSNPIGNAGDYRSWAGTGPLTIAPGDTAWVTFALVAGDDLNNIRANARGAATKASALGWTQPSFKAILSPRQVFTQITNDILATDLEFSSGVSWGDYNNDGFQDMLVSNLSPLHGTSLYKNNGNGSFMKVTNGEVANDAGQSFSAIWGDYDNDGYLDLYISNGGSSTATPPLTRNFLYRNQGPPGYELARVKSGAIVSDSSYTWSSAWVDYDNDGDLDLHAPASRRLTNNPDLFYENTGAGNFARVTALPFLNTGVTRTLGCSWIDYDNDGDQDLLLSKDGSDIGGEAKQLWKNLLKENEQVAFTKITTGELGTDMLLDFSASWGDYDNDGDADLFTPVFGSNNVLYRNDASGSGGFTRIQTGILTNDGRNTVGSAWVDFDNDGDLDLFVANTAQISRLYRNDGMGNFLTVSPAQMGLSLLFTSSNAQGCAWADYDRDGDLDLYIANASINGTS